MKFFAAIAAVSALRLASSNTCSPACTGSQTCNNGTCSLAQTCNPACTGNQTCTNGTCSLAQACSPACTGNKTCNASNQCV